MIAFDPDSACARAEAYYYEYLCNELREDILAEILVHIDTCSSCQAEVGRLKVILAEGKEHAVGSPGQTTAAITTNLKFHFAYLGAFVGCNTLKLFLPSLAIPAIEVSVPTPITAHLDKCEQCASDLETIRQLKLTDKQLGRLGQLFAEKPGKYNVSCGQAYDAVLAVLSMDFRETKEEVLKHFCTCPHCRKLLYQYRETFRTKHLHEKKKQKIPCDEVSATDIFDYVVPYGIDPANDQYEMFRKSLTSHLINCQRCLDKMQKLHDTVYSILERHESGIVTCYSIYDSGRDTTAGCTDDTYEDWPIEVQVFDKSDETENIEARSAGIEMSLRPTQRLLLPKIRPFIKPGAVAAAVILVALLLLNAPVAKAVNLGQIYKALERIKNVCITTSYREESNKIQEVWISQTLNIKILKTRDECTLWDLNAKSEKSKNLNTGSIAMTELDGAALLKVKGTMEGLLGLLPCNSMPEAPEGAQWLPVANENIDTKIPGTEVYDLVWTEKSLIGSIIHRKWRGYIDIESKLPKRIEWWMKLLAEEEEYRLVTVTEISYPTTVEMKAVIKDAGF